MAIIKTYIDGNWNTLKDFLAGALLFESVTLSSNTVTCKDQDSNTVLTIGPGTSGGTTITAYADASTPVSRTWYTSNYGLKFMNGYKCSHGVMLEYAGTETLEYRACLLLTSTNNHSVACVFTTGIGGQSGISHAPFLSYYSVAWGDVGPISAHTFDANQTNQTILIPFVTNANVGDETKTPNAGFMPFGQYYRLSASGSMYTKMTLGDDTYLTNGYWAIKD